MTDINEEILGLLREMRKLLIPISACFEQQYFEIRREQKELAEFQAFLTPTRAKIYPLLFDSRRLKQGQMAEEAGTSQPTVSTFIGSLLKRGWIQEDDTGEAPYREVFPFRKMMEMTDEEQ